jgi:tripartite-type tricarboxylate transporter receptor subunit TctC
LVEVGVHSPHKFARPFVLSPGVPKEQVQILRNAFEETLKDKDFLAETEKMKLGLNPLTGGDLEKTVAGIFRLDSAMLGKLKDILYK